MDCYWVGGSTQLLIVENQMEKRMENEMEAIILVLYSI